MGRLKVTNMARMFASASIFTKTFLDGTSRGRNMSYMFMVLLPSTKTSLDGHLECHQDELQVVVCLQPKSFALGSKLPFGEKTIDTAGFVSGRQMSLRQTITSFDTTPPGPSALRMF
jgi:hypothetical protein